MIHKRKPIRISHQRAVMLSPNWLESFSARRVTCTKKNIYCQHASVHNREQTSVCFCFWTSLFCLVRCICCLDFYTLSTIEFDTFLQTWLSSLLSYRRCLMLMLQQCDPGETIHHY